MEEETIRVKVKRVIIRTIDRIDADTIEAEIEEVILEY